MGVAESLTLMLLGPFLLSCLVRPCLVDILGRPALFRRETRRDADQREMGGCAS